MSELLMGCVADMDERIRFEDPGTIGTLVVEPVHSVAVAIVPLTTVLSPSHAKGRADGVFNLTLESSSSFRYRDSSDKLTLLRSGEMPEPCRGGYSHTHLSFPSKHMHKPTNNFYLLGVPGILYGVLGPDH